MDWQIFYLSVIQSLTEFLPVSSSGHLILFSKILRLPDQGLVVDISLHLGTLLAVVAYFFPTVLKLIKGVFSKGEGRTLLLKLIIGTLPAVAAGGLLSSFIEQSLRSPYIIACTSIFFGVLLYVADSSNPGEKTVGDITFKNAFVIGCFQALALIPGTSRSGITMTAGRFLKLKRKDAAEFSMLLSMPVIFAGGLFMVLKTFLKGDTVILNAGLAWGVLTSFIFGLLAISFLMKWLKKASFAPFSIYRVFLGIGLIVYLAG